MELPTHSRLRAWADHLLGLIYPEVCQLCTEQRAARVRAYVCDACRDAVRMIEPPYCRTCGRPYEGAITNEFQCDACREAEHRFCWARSAAAAEGPVLDAIHKYKYNRQLWLEPFLGELLVNAAAKTLQTSTWTGLVPVPLWPTKEREREFNQAERLARILGEAAGVPVDTKLLRRVVPTPSQTRLSRRERAENMRGAFALCSNANAPSGDYVLIDDVFTTGATTDACAKVLLKAGAANVAVWTVARGL
jgi:competence protein ComFC